MIESTWQPPDIASLPDLRRAKAISLDIETRDPNLLTKGPGGVREDGYLVGISLATEDFKCYLPMRHEGGDNLDPDTVRRYVADMLSTDLPKVGANLLYDLEWLKTEGIEVAGTKWDVQIAEPLLDEDLPTYKLDSLAERHLGLHKEEGLMEAATKELFGLGPDKVKENLWRLPARYVGLYGEVDADLPLRIFAKQRALLDAEGLWPVFSMESRLIDVLLKMRFKGIPVDIERAHQVREQLTKEQVKLESQLVDMSKLTEFDVWSNESIAAACDMNKITYPRTAKGNPSFTGDWLDSQNNDFLSMVKRVRKLDRMGSVFVQSKIIDVHHKGRIFPTFRQVKSDEGGTRGGRFASANPNMQQVPSRDPEMAPLIRSIFVPESGCNWASFDHAQQEPRLTVHYAYISEMEGAEYARNKYITEPETDYHQLVADMAGIDRPTAKTINLGLAYGMGKAKLAISLGVDAKLAEEISNKYHDSVPYMKLLGEECKRRAKKRGYIKTFLGRKKHFNFYGPKKYTPDAKPLRYEAAKEAYGEWIDVWFIHKAMNSLIQGSAADMIKKNILDCADAGYISPLTVHDELCFVDLPNEAAMKEVKFIMENSMKLEVPVLVDTKIGKNWGEVKKVKFV